MSTLSRRGFINLVGKAGGVSAVYQTMAAMGLLPVPAAYSGPPSLAPGNGTRVVILGAGIAGMVAALELGKAGYECRVLEARSRPGATTGPCAAVIRSRKSTRRSGSPG